MWDSHGIQRQISYASPGNHDVPRFFNPSDLLAFKRVKQIAEVVISREFLIGRRSAFFHPVLVVGLRYAASPKYRHRVSRRQLEPEVA